MPVSIRTVGNVVFTGAQERFFHHQRNIFNLRFAVSFFLHKLQTVLYNFLGILNYFIYTDLSELYESGQAQVLIIDVDTACESLTVV